MVGRRGGGVGCRGLLGWVCPKRRGLKPRWRGCLQETMRWAGVFGVFSVCFRCAFGVALHGVRADLLRFGHLARSLRRAGTRVRAAPERAGLGRGARGRLGLVVDEGLRCQREFKADHEGRGLVIGDEVGVEGGSHRRRLDPPRRFRPPLPRRPGLDQPRLPPSTLEDRPRTTDTTCRNTRESTNKTSAFSTSMDSPAHALRPA